MRNPVSLGCSASRNDLGVLHASKLRWANWSERAAWVFLVMVFIVAVLVILRSRARPIKHYQSIVIHKATRLLTKPVSPMIGEKRKRHEMEMKYQEQQQEREQWEARLPGAAAARGADIATNTPKTSTTTTPEVSPKPRSGPVIGFVEDQG